MNNDGRDADGFTLVGKRRRGKRTVFAQNEGSAIREDRLGNFKIAQGLEIERKVDKLVVANKILRARDELQISEFYRSFQVSLVENLRERRTTLIDQGSVNILEESCEQQASHCNRETQSNISEVYKRSSKCPQDSADVKDEQVTMPTECNKDTLKSSDCGPHSKLQSNRSEDRFLGDLTDEIMKVKGQASGEVKGQASDGVLSGPVQIVVCFGLGNFSECAIARYQLALLLLICDNLKVKLSDCHLYDPRFTAEEMEVLTNLGLKIIPQNEECKRMATKPTFFYMPHCGKPLYNNLLWANWNMNELANVIIIGNSFNNIQERLPTSVLQEFRYLHQIIPHTREVPVTNNFRFADIFNDTSIHLFPSERLQTLPSAFWDRDDEPRYDTDTAIEIVLSK